MLMNIIRSVRSCCRPLTISAYKNEPKKGDQGDSPAFQRSFVFAEGGAVIVGMSGGVDSSVAALLLANEDYDLSAVYMRNWDTRDEHATDKGCEWEKDWEDVQIVCKKLGIPCTLTDLTKEYWNRVFEPALRQWEHGITPNPDVWCNKEIKFGELLRRLPLSTSENAWFATGHYAAKSWTNSSSQEPRPKLVRPTDRQKDQTYFLSAIPEAALRRSLFPLAHLTKPEVRALARRHDLGTAERSDSVGICFVGEKARFHRFLADYIPAKPGPMVHNLTGKIVGEHQGLWQFTIGQNVRLGGLPHKLYVSKKNIDTNTMYVVPGNTHESLMTRSVRVIDFHWIWHKELPIGIDTSEGARLLFVPRYRTEPARCTVWLRQDDMLIECDDIQHAITPGQIAVLYDGDWCLGSGVIASAS